MIEIQLSQNIVICQCLADHCQMSKMSNVCFTNKCQMYDHLPQLLCSPLTNHNYFAEHQPLSLK